MNGKKTRKIRSADEAKKTLDALKVSSQQKLANFKHETDEIIKRLKNTDGLSSMEYPTFMTGGKSQETAFEK